MEKKELTKEEIEKMIRKLNNKLDDRIYKYQQAEGKQNEKSQNI